MSKLNLDKVLTPMGFVFILLALIIIVIIPPAARYEISIYESYPPLFWFLICSIICGILILLHHTFAPERRSRSWATGFSIVISANLILILLPIFREYFISDLADEVAHLGQIKDIALTGHAGISDVYPISHILAFQLSSVCGLDSRLVIKIIPSIFYLTYMAGLFLLARAIKTEPRQVLLVMAFGSVLLFTYFNYQFLPTQLFLFLVPLTLFLFFRRKSPPSLRYNTIFIIALLPLPFLHPLGSILLVAIFLVFELSMLIHRSWLSKRSYVPNVTIPYSLGTALTPAMIVFIIFFSWFSNFAHFRTTVAQAYEWFVYGFGTSTLEMMREQWQMANFTIPDFMDLFIKNYGHDFLFLSLSLIAIFIILRKVFSARSPLEIGETFFSLLFLLFSLFYVSTVLGAFISLGRSLRVYCWPLVASTVLNGMVFHEWISKLRANRFKMGVCLLTITIIIAAVIGVFSVYPSPHTRQANVQVTKMDWRGMEWFFNYKGDDGTIYFDQLVLRAPDYIYGRDMPKPKSVGSFYPVPPHLGYDKNESIAHSFDFNPYLVISKRIRAAKSQLWPDLGRYTLNELNRLNSDPGVSMVYSNGELEIWQITGEA